MDLSGLPPESEASRRAPALAHQRHQHTNHQDQERASRLSQFLSSFSAAAAAAATATATASPAHKEASDPSQPQPPHIETPSTRLGNHVNPDLVREMIAQHAIEFLIILVIIIYLVYYFSKISRKPKLIGNTQSPFVASIKNNFKSTLKSRFSPLIYFWGTNPQTALFGYLQGQTSNDEVPRSKFHRQFLYVSDAQYLASNIDLSEHYEKCKNRRLSSRHQIFYHNHHHHQHHLDHLAQQPAVGTEKQQEQEQRTESNQAAVKQKEQQSLLHQNIQMVIEGTAGSQRHVRLTRTASGDCSDSSAIGSSSDSGVFANENTSASSSSSSSSSSRSSLTIDMSSVTSTPPSRQSQPSSIRRGPQSTTSNSSHASSGCDLCNSLYEQPPEALLDEELQLMSNKTPPSLMSGGHDTKQQSPQQQFKREQFEFGQCALDWFIDSHEQYHKSKSVALISAGMTTGSDKKYVTDTVQTLHKLGYEVCVFIRRGVGGLKLNSTKFFSPSKWRDFESAILSIKRQRPNCRLVSIGFSFGSIELCRYLSMSGTRSLVDLALLISCPFDPEAGGRNMRKRALNRKIDAYLAKNLGKQLHQALSFDDSAASESSTLSSSSVATDEDRTTLEMMIEGHEQRQHKICKSISSSDGDSSSGKGSSTTTTTSTSSQQVHVNYNGSIVDLSSLPKIRSLVDFEDNFNRVIQHYPTSDAYGADSRLNDQLANIRTPTLCLSSEDDFMAPVKLLPIKQIQANGNLCMILTKRGGHMAFIDGLVWPKRPYFAQRIIEEYMKLPQAPPTPVDH